MERERNRARYGNRRGGPPPPPATPPPRTPRPKPGAELRRLRRFVALGLVLVVSAVTLGSTLRDRGKATADPGAGGPAPASRLVESGPASPGVPIAQQDAVRLWLPIAQSRVTAVLYHPVDGSPALSLSPFGKLLDAGLVDRLEQGLAGSEQRGMRYYQVGEPRSVDIGAPVGTDVYAPVDGEVVSIVPNIIDGRPWGSVVTIQPTINPSVAVVVSNIEPPATLKVGDEVSAVRHPTPLGSVVDMSEVMQMEMRHYTQDAGNGVHIEIVPNVTATAP